MSHSDVVRGYMFISVGEVGVDRNETICQIIGRDTEISDNEVVENGPAFRVRFGDGHVLTAFSSELHPWYPT